MVHICAHVFISYIFSSSIPCVRLYWPTLGLIACAMSVEIASLDVELRFQSQRKEHDAWNNVQATRLPECG